MDDLEHRIRRHLATLDRADPPDGETIAAAARRIGTRTQRRKRVAVAALSFALVAIAGIGISLSRDTTGATDTAATTPVATVPTTPSTVPATVIAGSVPTTSAGTPDSWRSLAPDPRGAVPPDAPAQATRPSVIWTGSLAIVTGGTDRDGVPVAGASAYDPLNDIWRTLADPPLQGRHDEIAVWTAKDMLVIGGDTSDGVEVTLTGQAYDPATDRWRGITTSPSGLVTSRSPWAWTGSELLVWPWDTDHPELSVAPAAYDPTTDGWRALTPPPIAPRQGAASVWTGTEWIIWGGVDRDIGPDGFTTDAHRLFGDGAAYDPAADTWRIIADAPIGARLAGGVWTGSELLIQAGRSASQSPMAYADGAAYDPATDTWRSITPGIAHPGAQPLFTGRYLLQFFKGTVGVYDYATDTWPSTCCSGGGSTGNPIWTGTEALVFGSYDNSSGGAAYTPPDP
jgi:hypothetical protein